MKRAGYDIGRDQVARLMRIAGLHGIVRGRKPITTKPAKSPDTRPDLVQRNFRTSASNRSWVADITYDTPPIDTLFDRYPGNDVTKPQGVMPT